MLGDRLLEVSWSATVFTIPGVYTWYRVHVRDLTVPADVLDIYVAGAKTSYVYRHSQGNPCHVYQFAVLAENAAGASDYGVPSASSIPTSMLIKDHPVFNKRNLTICMYFCLHF